MGYKEPPPVSPYSNDATPFQIIANSAVQVPVFCFSNKLTLTDFVIVLERSKVTELIRLSYSFQIFPDGHITPGILVANTDTKHYLHLTDNVYR